MMLNWILSFFMGLLGYIFLLAYNRSRFWKRKGVPSTKSLLPLLGSFIDAARVGQGHFDLKWTQKLGRVFGYFDGPNPVIIVSDTDMLKNIMVKEFSHFVDRKDTHLNGKILDQALNSLKGQRWKDVRSVLAPAFSSGKLRQMSHLINECMDTTVSNVARFAETGDEFDVKKLFGTVTLDVVASTFFGTKIDAQNDPNNLFVKNAYRAFNISILRPAILISIFCPALIPLARKLGLHIMDQVPLNFFVQSTEEIIKLRLKSNQGRRDFLQLMLKSLKAEDVGQFSHQTVDEPFDKRESESGSDILSDILTNGITEDKERVSDYKMTAEEIIAQLIVFFLAGYETTANALSFMTYLLAIHPEIQERLRSEIEEVMDGHEKPDYDLIAKMEYLDMCVNETVRLYPPVGRADRECTQDWEFNGLTIEKGTIIGIPVFAIHRDPEFWPEPETFNPERFSYENKKKIKPFTFQTFGQGPRNCVGMRFAYYEIKMVMVSLLQNFRFVQSPRTQIPIVLKDIGLISAKDGVWITAEKLSS